MKKVLSIFIFVLFAVGNVMADTLDMSMPSVQVGDTTNIRQQNETEYKMQFDSFWIGVGSSSLAALIMLLLFFKFLRPRIAVAPIVAISKGKNKPLQFQILVKNISIFEVNDIKIELEGVIKLENDDIKSVPIIETPIQILSLKGIFSDSNLREECFTCKLPNESDKLPSQMVVTILSHHSLSGVVSGKKFVFNSDRYMKGSYTKGLFIPKGLTYKQVLCRDSLLCMKWIFTISIVILLLEAVLLFVLKLLSIQNGIIIFATTFITTMLFAILWQQYIYAKGNAYNGGYINQNIQINMASINMDKSSSKDEKNKIPEEVPYVEIEKK